MRATEALAAISGQASKEYPFTHFDRWNEENYETIKRLREQVRQAKKLYTKTFDFLLDDGLLRD